MTGMLQPLDVAVNRSFQQAYGERYNAYMKRAVQCNNKSMQTQTGNIKIPQYADISTWVADWMKYKSPESIAKAFTLCGFVKRDAFKVEDFHQPLRAACFDNNFSIVQWEAKHAAAIENFSENFEEVNADWIFYSIAFPLFKALFEF